MHTHVEIDPARRAFRSVVDAHASPNGVRVDFEQPVIVRYRVTPPGPNHERTLDIESVERDIRRGEYWDNRVSRDYTASLTDADWDRLTEEAWADFWADR